MVKNISFEKQMQVLDSLGFHVINEVDFHERVQEIRDNMLDITDSFFEDYPYTELLMVIATGTIKNNERVPFNTKMFGFDTECVDGLMPYTAILHYLEQHSNELIAFKNIQEEVIEGDDYAYKISFIAYNQTYEWQSGPLNGWFDYSLLDFINGILEEHGLAERIYTLHDYQNLGVVFIDENERNKIFEETNIRLGLGSECHRHS